MWQCVWILSIDTHITWLKHWQRLQLPRLLLVYGDNKGFLTGHSVGTQFLAFHSAPGHSHSVFFFHWETSMGYTFGPNCWDRDTQVVAYLSAPEHSCPDWWEVGTWSTLHLASNTFFYAYITLPFGMLKVHFFATGTLEHHFPKLEEVHLKWVTSKTLLKHFGSGKLA